MRARFNYNKILADIRSRTPEKSIPYLEGDPAALARLFADIFQDRLRFCKTSKSWYEYDGRLWHIDKNMAAEVATVVFLRAMSEYSASFAGDKSLKQFVAGVDKLRSFQARKNLLLDAASVYPVQVEEFDVNPFLLNCENGVLDLQSCTLIDHTPDLMQSKIAGCEYIAGARSDLWLKTVDEIMQGDAEKTRYLQKVFGLCLSGDTVDKLFILYGPSTRNGKSLCVETLAAVLRDYAMTIQVETLAQRKRDSRTASGDLERLRASRVINAAEWPKTMVLDPALLKTFTGHDTITARALYSSEIEFIPMFKIMINSNYLPTIYDQTVFMSERLSVIPFNRHFESWEQDRKLRSKLKTKENLSGVLSWCVDGWKMYQDEGLEPPGCVSEAVDLYRTQSDKVGCFISECLEPSDSNLSGGDVYRSYQSWCHDSGYQCEGKQNFYKDLKSRGILSTATVRGYTEKNAVTGYRFVSEYDTMY